jgi:nucleoside-diphosphate-sugar epimerase
MKELLTLGHGYSAQALTRRLLSAGWHVSGTTRDPAQASDMVASGITAILLPQPDPCAAAAELSAALQRASHILVSAAPDARGNSGGNSGGESDGESRGDAGSDAGGDPFLHSFGPMIRAARPEWLGYLSTTSVYGDRAGGWVDECDELRPQTERGRERVRAEAAWLASGLPVHIFRLAGIYGPGRGPLEKVLRGGPAVIKPGQVFGRIHVEDIAQALEASINHPDPGRVYNLCDDEPAAAEVVLDHAAALLGLPAPHRLAFDPAAMSEIARSFYTECKRVRNDRIKTELGLQLLYPSYREGLAAQIAVTKLAPGGRRADQVR